MMQQNTSPEERLLRLIRKEALQPMHEKKEVDEAPKPFGLKKNIISLFFSWLPNRTMRCLLALLLILGIFLLSDFFISRGKNKEPIPYSTQPTKSRNLFTTQTGVGRRPPSATFMEKISKFRLQGIITEPYPQAIIEDATSRKAYFLSPGEMIGGMKIKEILPGKVRLYYRGEETELAL